MLHDRMKQMKLRYNYTIDLFFPGDKPPLVDIDLLGDKLSLMLKQNRINLFPRHTLVAVDDMEWVHFLLCALNSLLTMLLPVSRTATFTQPGSKTETVVPFVAMHFTPSVTLDQHVKASSLANKAGLVDINRFTMQHKEYKNIYSLGSCAFPMHTTAGTALRQSSVVAYNLLNYLSGKSSANPMYYDGWNAAPFMTDLSKLT